MARGAVGIIMAIARDVARHQRQVEAAQNRARKEAERQTRAALREFERQEIAAHRHTLLNEKERTREEKLAIWQSASRKSSISMRPSRNVCVRSIRSSITHSRLTIQFPSTAYAFTISPLTSLFRRIFDRCQTVPLKLRLSLPWGNREEYGVPFRGQSENTKAR